MSYVDNTAFNEYVDESYSTIRIFDVEFRPSEVLFQMEPESYRVYLAEVDLAAEAEDPDAGAALKPKDPTP